MSLKDLLAAQKSGELDSQPGSPFNNPSPLVISDDFAYVMFDGMEWYMADITEEIVKEALELLNIDLNDVEMSENKVVEKSTGKILFEGEDIIDLFGGIVTEAGIYTERH